MTTARQPQRKYIITEEQVEYIEPEFPITAMRIRSRPHTSPPAPEPDVTMAVLKRIGEQPEFKESWEKMLNAERNYLCGDIYNIIYSCQYTAPAKMGEISKICKLCNYETDCKEHDAQVAKAERERLFREMERRLDLRPLVRDAQGERCRMLEIIEDLEAGREDPHERPQQEGRR